jgi:hypothetical protein
MLCKYKNILGKPNTGIHSYKFYGISMGDVGLTILGAALISWLSNLNFFLILIILFLSGIILHRIFCVRTTVDKLIFGK